MYYRCMLLHVPGPISTKRCDVVSWNTTARTLPARGMERVDTVSMLVVVHQRPGHLSIAKSICTYICDHVQALNVALVRTACGSNTGCLCCIQDTCDVDMYTNRKFGQTTRTNLYARYIPTVNLVKQPEQTYTPGIYRHRRDVTLRATFWYNSKHTGLITIVQRVHHIIVKQ